MDRTPSNNQPCARSICGCCRLRSCLMCSPISIGSCELCRISPLRRRPLGMSAGTFGLPSACLLGYFIFEVPSNVILGKGRRLVRTMDRPDHDHLGILAGLTAVVTGLDEFRDRALLWRRRAGFFPGIILYFTYWFPSHHHAHRVRLSSRAAVAVAVGAPISTGPPRPGWLVRSARWQVMYIAKQFQPW